LPTPSSRSVTRVRDPDYLLTTIMIDHRTLFICCVSQLLSTPQVFRRQNYRIRFGTALNGGSGTSGR
jgi:hypothetical protein